MTTEPEQIRAQIEAVLAELLELDDSGQADLAGTEIDAITSRLSAAHDMLVRALESAEKG